MNAALLVLWTLTMVSLSFLPVDGQAPTCCENCCDVICDAPDPFNITLDEFVGLQPIYISFFPAISTLFGVDNACFTYEPLIDGSYLQTISIVYCNGMNSTEIVIVTEEGPGVSDFGSATCSGQATIFDFLDSGDCTLYLAYFCFSIDTCTLALGNDIPVFGLSTNNTPISQDCLDTAIDRIARAGVPSQNYTIAPFEQDDACIFNATCSAQSS